MEQSLYDRADNKFRILHHIVDNLLFEEQDADIGYKLRSLNYIIEFDNFKKEYPDTYKLYLSEFRQRYKVLWHLFVFYTGHEKGEPPLLEGKSVAYRAFISTLQHCLIDINNHLKGMLEPETDIEETTQKFKKLKPIEKILIVYYLNQQNKLFKNPLNQLSLKSGKYFLSHLLDINPESIKNPVANIYDYTTEIEKMTQQKALNLFPTLETVKSFFDKSELSEISKVIETRINVLREKAGKD